MAKFYGLVGFATQTETAPDVWEEVLTERNYSGDILENNRRWNDGESLNDNAEISNIISIVADPYANQNLHTMRYINWMGASWKIKNIKVLRPRLILTIGGVYNGK